MVVAGTAGQAVAKFIEAAAEGGGAGATTEDSAAAAAAQTSNAPNQEDLAAAPAPQLAETTDPVGNTRPEVPESEFETGATQSTLLDPLGDPENFLEAVLQEIGNAEEDWDPMEIQELMDQLEEQLYAARRFIVVGGEYSRAPFRVKQTSKLLADGKFAPVS